MVPQHKDRFPFRFVSLQLKQDTAHCPEKNRKSVNLQISNPINVGRLENLIYSPPTLNFTFFPFSLAMENANACANWNESLEYASPFQTFVSDSVGFEDQYNGLDYASPLVTLNHYDGCKYQYTANELDPFDILTYTSSFEKSYDILTKISTPSYLNRHIIGACGFDMEKLTKKLPHVQVSIKEGKIVIQGPVNEVHIARAFLVHLAEILESTIVVDDVHVNGKFHGLIIGKNGQNVNRIQKETCTAIYTSSYLQRVGHAIPSDVVLIEGYPAGVHAAKQIILQIVGQTLQSDETTKADNWHEVTGISGQNAKELHESFGGAQVDFPPELGGSNCNPALYGPRKQIEGCAKYPEKECKIDLLTATVYVVVRVAKKLHRHLVGRNGSIITKIRKTTETWINVPEKSVDSDVILVIGKRDNVDKALVMITDILKKTEIFHDQPNGNIEENMLTTTNITEDLEAREENKTKVPSQTEIKEVNQKFLRVVKQPARKRFDSVKLDPSVYGMIIGAKGSTIFKFEQKHNVMVDFPRPDSGNDLVTIYGQEEDIKIAKSQLLEMASRFMHTL